jgi:demethylmenaquinone methyltransferase / 2-methoxy-6-polyprenyl-1,4-benzoquinol methylase
MIPATDRPARPEGGSGTMFDGIAARYDLVNRIISLGLDQGWRVRTVDALGLAKRSLSEPVQVLDLATGTGDLALLLADKLPQASIVGVDPSEKMLEVGRRKVEASGAKGRVRLEMGSAESLPFPTGTFHGTTIAFGIRNVGDREQGLREMARVTRRDGKVAVLELSEPQSGFVAPLARFHVHTMVPWVGSLLSGAKEYRYLQKSIAAFPSANEFARMMGASNLVVEQVVPLFFGVAHLYVARPSRSHDD